MKKLILDIKKLKKDKKLNEEIKQRIREFESFNKKSDKKWFSELCFCILTANSSATLCMKIQKEAEKENACIRFSKGKISSFLKKSGYRFYNKRAEYIIKARKFIDVKRHIRQNDKEAREWLVSNIKGLGWKEASHFLRNTGRKNVAIIDRHILRVLGEKAGTLNEKNYLRIEEKLKRIADSVALNLAELDLYRWSTQTGKVLK